MQSQLSVNLFFLVFFFFGFVFVLLLLILENDKSVSTSARSNVLFPVDEMKRERKKKKSFADHTFRAIFLLLLLIAVLRWDDGSGFVCGIDFVYSPNPIVHGITQSINVKKFCVR